MLQGIPRKLHICIFGSDLSQRSDPYSKDFRSHSKPPEGHIYGPAALSFCVSNQLGSCQVHFTWLLQIPALFSGLASRPIFFFFLQHYSKINIPYLVSLFLHNSFCIPIACIWKLAFQCGLTHYYHLRTDYINPASGHYLCHSCFALAVQKSPAAVITSIPGGWLHSGTCLETLRLLPHNKWCINLTNEIDPQVVGLPLSKDALGCTGSEYWMVSILKPGK